MVEAHSGTRRSSPRGGARAGEEQEEWEENEILGGGMGKTAMLYTSIYAILNSSHKGGGGLKN